MNGVFRMGLIGAVCASWAYGDWERVQTVLSDHLGSQYGYSIAVDGNFAVVGAPNEYSGGGAVYILKAEDNGTWSPFQKIENIEIVSSESNLVKYEFKTLGWDVDIAENDMGGMNAVLAIGAPQSTRWDYKNSGAPSYSFYWDDSPESGILIYNLNAEGTAFEYTRYYLGNDHNDTGLAVSVAQTSTIVGYEAGGGFVMPVFGLLNAVVAGHPDDNNVTTYLNRNGTNEWRELTLSHVGTGDGFGTSLSIDRDMSHLLVGAPYRDIEAYADKGSVYFYKLSGSWADNNIAWGEERVFSHNVSLPILFNCQYNEQSHFGISVNLRNDKAIVGAERENVSCRAGSFSPYVIQGAATPYMLSDSSGNNWAQMGSLPTGSGVDAMDDGFGLAVAVAGNRAIVGAPGFGDSKRTGAAFIYDYNGTAWSESLSIVSEEDGTFGQDVALFGNQLFITDEANGETAIYEYKTPVRTGIDPALIMYLLN